MSGGLSIADVVSVQVFLSPLPVAQRNFGSLVIIGPTEGVINTSERMRTYSTITQVAQDFGTTVPEYLAANLYFEQAPQPAQVFIGRWAQAATHGWLFGATLPTSDQLMTVWNPVTAGSMTISIDGTPHAVSGLNFSAQSNMNGIASVIQAGLPAGALCTWDAVYNRFKIRGIVTGVSGAVSYATATGSGTDISGSSGTAPLYTGLAQAAGASAPAPGIAVETPLQCITALAALSNSWYGAMFAPTLATDITDSQYEAVANFIEASNPSRIFGITSQEANIVDPTQTTDLASVLQSLNLQHTCIQYSSSSVYAIASLFGRAFTVNFTANNSTITLKFQQEPGVVAETLSETQAAALNAKNCNVFVNYNVGVAIIQQGVMCGGFFFDERQGLDWLQNEVQTNLFNILFNSTSKIPYTDPGMHVLVTGVVDAMNDGVNNGLIAAGVWNSPAVFGQLTQGQFLSTGFYVFVPSVNTVSETQRSARIAPTIQCAVKLAGAVHFASAILNVNR